MDSSKGSLTSILKRILFRQSMKHMRLQPLWSKLHTLSIFGMNYGGGGLIESSGELWVLENVISARLKDVSQPVVFDVGANVGDYSLSVLRYLPSAKVYAFEPSEAVYGKLLETINESELAENILPRNIGFSDSEKIVEFYSYTVEGQEVSLLSSIDVRLPTQVVDVKTHSSEQIRVRTVDGFCSEENIDHIDFLKLDVEGHELAVLRGAREMLDKGAVSIIQFEFGPANIYSRTYFYDFWSLLSGAYAIYRIIPGSIVPIRYYGEHNEIFLTTNYLAVKKQ